MKTAWVVIVQKQDQHGGFGAPIILGQKAYTDEAEAERVRNGIAHTGGMARAHAYLMEVEIL